MIVDVNEVTLASIRNPTLRCYAEQYVRIYQDFMQQVRDMGIEVEEADDGERVRGRIAVLGRKGAIVRNDGKSVYVNRISPSCQACQTGVGSLTFSVSLKCHRQCFFCFNPNQEDYEYQREHKRDVVGELDALLASGQKLEHLALTGGEPLLDKEETLNFFQRARQNSPNAYTRLYTCGDHLERETLQALKDAGLNEIRVSIRLEDAEKARQHTLEQVALAREYIPNVMVEMPILPGSLSEMKTILTELDRLGVFGVNLLELCFPFHNVDQFRSRGYSIKARPYRVPHNYRGYAGGLPVAGSEATCLDLIEFALEAGLSLGVHYCSLENRQTSQVYEQNITAANSGVLYFSKRDYFLKTAKVFGKDMLPAKQIFDRNSYHEYRSSNDYHFLEFHVDKIEMLRSLDIEVGVSTNVLEMREGETYLRELKVDVTNPQIFQLTDI